MGRLATILCLALVTAGLPARATETLVFAHMYPETSVQQQALLEAREELARRSQHQIELKIIPNGQLGDQDTRLIEAIGAGRADMTFAGALFAARDYAPIGLLSAPYNFRDFDHWQHFRDSALARDLAASYETASGMVVLGYYYYGTRHLNAARPLPGIGALSGLRLRVPNAPIMLRLFRELGANPVPVPIAQTFDALKNGDVAAEENPLPAIVDFRFNKVAPCVMLTGHLIDTTIVIIGARSLARLSPDHQALVRDLFDRLSRRLSSRMRARERDIEMHPGSFGLTLVPVDRDAFRVKAAPLLTGTAFTWSGDLYQRLQAIP